MGNLSTPLKTRGFLKKVDVAVDELASTDVVIPEEHFLSLSGKLITNVVSAFIQTQTWKAKCVHARWKLARGA